TAWPATAPRKPPPTAWPCCRGGRSDGLQLPGRDGRQARGGKREHESGSLLLPRREVLRDHGVYRHQLGREEAGREAVGPDADVLPVLRQEVQHRGGAGMFFRNLSLFRFPTSHDFSQLAELLPEAVLKPVGPLELTSAGFI